MTPLKSLILHGTAIYARDHADNVELKAIALNEDDAAWLAGSLAAFHKVEIEHLPPGTPILAAMVR